LSSPVISKHVHGAANPGQSAGILFDLTRFRAVRMARISGCLSR
jgi:hypothetical protein